MKPRLRSNKNPGRTQSLASLEVGGQPFQTWEKESQFWDKKEFDLGLGTFVKTVAASSTGSLDIPTPLPQTVESQFIGDFSGVHGVGKILFVRENEKESITKLILIEHALKLLACLGNTFTIVRINYEYDSLGILEV